MAMATASAAMESQTLIQTEARVQRFQESKTETRSVSERTVKKKKSMRRHTDEGTVSVSKSSEKLHKKMKASEPDSNPQCSKCARPVFAMERVKAERRVWHKECFRCVQCNKQLTVETYQSDHTTLYCKPHFKQLFEPKPVDGDDELDATPKRHQMIICESNPIELPPDVVRASDKTDLGLNELSQLDVKSRFEVFENKKQEEPAPLEPRTKRETSTALLSKLAKFKAKGMDVGVSDEYLNGVPVEASSSEPEDEEDDEDSVLKKSYKHTTNKEQPVSFCNMSEIVGKFESGQHAATERHRERKQEIQNIRSRLFMGKQAKIKEMYEQSVMQSEQGVTSSDKIAHELELDADKARAIKQRFENGDVFNDENQPPKARDIDDRALFNDGEGGPKAKSIKERFESGEIYNDDKFQRFKEQKAQIDEEKARSIKQRFETGEVYKDEREIPRHKDVQMETLQKEGAEKALIKERFETGKVFEDKNLEKYKNIESANVEGEGELKAKSIKERFESGEIYKDNCYRLKEHKAQNAQIDEEKARFIKESFETGEVFKDEKGIAKQKDVQMEKLQKEGAEKALIKERFETGKIYEDKHVEKIKNIENGTVEGEGELKAKSIKERFETGEIYKDNFYRLKEQRAQDAQIDEEKARFIKESFETGEAYKDEREIPRHKDAQMEMLQKEGTDKALIKESFESGKVFKDKHLGKHKDLESGTLEGSDKASIKKRFETGEVYNDEKQKHKDDEIGPLISEGSDKERIKQLFETGELFRDSHLHRLKTTEIDNPAIFDEGIGKKSRSIFLELDANAATAPLTPPANDPPRRKEIPFVPKDVIRADDKMEDVKIETADITDRFKFFETYKPESKRKEFRMTPPRQQRPKSPSPELYHDPSVTRSAEPPVDISTAAERHTASRMINVFRTMEDQLARPQEQGPKPLKCFTPPPPGESNHRGDSSDEEYSSEEEDSEDERRRQYLEARERDDALKQAQQLARTKSFRDRFENWSETETQRSPSTVIIERQYDDDDGESQLETAKSLREKFENMQVTQSSVTKTSAPKVNRFV